MKGYSGSKRRTPNCGFRSSNRAGATKAGWPPPLAAAAMAAALPGPSGGGGPCCRHSFLASAASLPFGTRVSSSTSENTPERAAAGSVLQCSWSA